MKRLLLTGMALLSGNSHAALVTTIQEVGPDVVMTTNGSANMAGLFDPFNYGDPIPGMAPIVPMFLTGAPGPSLAYLGITSFPGSFGLGSQLPANSGTGPMMGIYDLGFGFELFMPPGYVSNTPITTSTATFSNKTLVSLGINPGTYTWGWGAGPDADTWQVQILSSSIVVPEPSTYIALVGFGALGLFLWRRRKAKRAAAPVA